MTGIEYVEIPGTAGTLRGMIHHGSADTVAVILHGYFSSNRIGPYRLYFELAERLRSEGVTTVRVDFSGMGESDGSIEAVRYRHHLDDYAAVLGAMESRYANAPLHVIAHCAGCHIALCGPVGSSLRGITLVAPFAPGSENFERRMFSAEEWRELVETGGTRRRGSYCHRSFVDASAVLSRPLPPAVKRLTRAIFAERDEMTPFGESKALAEALDIPYSSVPDADHNFISRDSKNALFGLIAATFRTAEDAA